VETEEGLPIFEEFMPSTSEQDAQKDPSSTNRLDRLEQILTQLVDSQRSVQQPQSAEAPEKKKTGSTKKEGPSEETKTSTKKDDKKKRRRHLRLKKRAAKSPRVNPMPNEENNLWLKH
jgi:hypothetical protein